MKRVIVIMLLLCSMAMLSAHAVLLTNGSMIIGEIEAVKDGNLYIRTKIMMMQVPVNIVDKIWHEGDAVSFSDLPSGQSYVVPSILGKITARTTSAINQMSDREFALYMAEKQRKTLWTIYGVSLGVGVLTAVLVSL